MRINENLSVEQACNEGSAYCDPWFVRNILLDVVCLVIIGEIVSLLAGGEFSVKATLITGIEVLVLLILSFLAKPIPSQAVITALILFISCSAITALVKPGFLGGSIIIKFFVLIYLLRSIPDARALQKLQTN